LDEDVLRDGMSDVVGVARWIKGKQVRKARLRRLFVEKDLSTSPELAGT